MAEFNQQFTGGAVDLGALAQQAEARREMESTAFEPFITVTERDVEAKAFERSMQVPVVLLVGSARSPESEALKATLEQLAQGQREFVVAYLDADASPQLAQALGVRAVPTAVALAAAMGADECEIYSDVDGVYTADPRIVPDAQKLDKLSFEEMLEMAAVGSKILVLRSVEYARAFNVPLRVRSSYSNDPGTLVTGSMEDIPVEEAVLTGVATDKSEAKVTVLGIPDRPGEAAKVFRVIADAEINIDMVLQNVSSLEDGTTDITFTCPRADGPRAMELLSKLKSEGGWSNVLYDDQVGKVSLVGAGMKSHPGVTADFCDSLRDAGINIEMITTSEIRITAVVREQDLAEAARAIHTKFELGGDEAAVVYAGTGR